MKKIIILLLCFTITGIVHSQETLEKVVRGRVFDDRTKRPLNGAMIELMNTEHKAYTDSTGYFNISVIKRTGSLVCSREGYITIIFGFRGPNWKGPHEIGLTETSIIVRDRQATDSIWTGILEQNKNALYCLPFELIIGSIGLQYERMLTLKHSVGLHTSAYLFGWGYSLFTGWETNNFTGVKIAPFYRFYTKPKADYRLFIEGKLMVGYFDMHPLLYREDYLSLTSGFETVGRNLNFWTCGGGIALGWEIRMPKKENGIFNLSLGAQLFPLLVTKYQDVYYENGYYDEYQRDEMWWYLGGPGSVFQIKVAYGGLF